MNSPFKFAQMTGGSMQKGMPGSHVIVKSNNEELPDRVFEEAGMLAGYYSKGREDEKVEIDYLQKKKCQETKRGRAGICRVLHKLLPDYPLDISGLTLVSVKKSRWGTTPTIFYFKYLSSEIFCHFDTSLVKKQDHDTHPDCIASTPIINSFPFFHTKFHKPAIWIIAQLRKPFTLISIGICSSFNLSTKLFHVLCIQCFIS